MDINSNYSSNYVWGNRICCASLVAGITLVALSALLLSGNYLSSLKGVSSAFGILGTVNASSIELGSGIALSITSLLLLYLNHRHQPKQEKKTEDTKPGPETKAKDSNSPLNSLDETAKLLGKTYLFSRDGLTEIFSCLSAGEVCKLGRVSKQWYEIACSNKVWENVCKKEGIHIPSNLNLSELGAVKDYYLDETDKLFPSYIKSIFSFSSVSYWNNPNRNSKIGEVVLCPGNLVIFGYEKNLIVFDAEKNERKELSINSADENDSLLHFEVFENMVIIKFKVGDSSNNTEYGIKALDMNGKRLYRIILSDVFYFKISDSELVVYIEKAISTDAQITFFDLKSGKDLEKTFKIGSLIQSFYLDGDSIVAEELHSSNISVWNKNTGKLLRRFGQEKDWSIGKVQVSNGLVACSYFDNSFIKIWNLKTGKCIQTFKFGFKIESRKFFKLVKGHLLVDTSTEKETRIEILNIATKKCVRSIISKHEKDSGSHYNFSNHRLKSLQVFKNVVFVRKYNQVIFWEADKKKAGFKLPSLSSLNS